MNWIATQTHRVFTALSQVFTAQLFELGGKPFSLSFLGQILVLSLVVLVIARTISEWIERRLLVRVELGTRKAIATVIAYLLSAIGFLIVLQSSGVNLSSLTVLAGAVGIGFAFGLQNLASNFISGITLLFEQPIKVGDLIEVEDLLGTVEKISIRSTIIRTLDGVFVIVPNIRFVENNIINWSYRDPKCRIHIPIGVAYGSETVLVTEALLAAARRETGVLSSPPPRVWFRSFGDSSLNFELLVWIDNPINIDTLKSALHFRLESELRCRGIEIPFPQRDLHIRTIKSIENSLTQPILGENGSTKIPNQNGNSQELSSPKPTPKSPNNWTLRDLLRRVSYFEKCSDIELRELIEYGYRQLFPGSQIVCRENDPGESFYLILSGSVEVFSQRTGKYIASLHSGEFFGEISLLMGTPRTASVRTLEDTILFVIDRNDLQKVLLNHRDLADQIADKLSERQQALRNLGLLDDDGELGATPFVWIRKRITTLFGI
ncbi:MAG TPA: mechanosensitive ion channel [Oscillatoriaceae cyanobacterium M33_DOE_052]|uniref:Mechanosensitive ion channel n=1 Tax=Planktothricoides sp. SpSt-374 TaxID=2282167 RepID=A0A7C3ZUN3_9CYAN|nr:mechanosensitive ion channel [Oscillatoriaceae cyanobacterium M33_DOE_052]